MKRLHEQDHEAHDQAEDAHGLGQGHAQEQVDPLTGRRGGVADGGLQVVAEQNA